MDQQSRFKKMSICLSGLAKGFLKGCRPFIGLVGTFLTRKYLGVILCVVGMDTDQEVFTLAFACVEGENKTFWRWFCGLQH